MKRNAVISLVSLAVLAAVGIGLGQTRSASLQKAGLSAEARQAILTVGEDMKKLVESHDRYVKASREAEALVAKLQESVREVSKAAKGKTKVDPTLLQAIKDLDQMSQSFNMQYLGLQQQMQNENRQFTLVSNIMKTKHDTAKNSIDNIR
jgi:hypothetical protein